MKDINYIKSNNIIVLPSQCSFVYKGIKCKLPVEFIIEVITKTNEKYMVGLTCNDHKKVLEEKFLSLQKKNLINEGKIIFTSIKVIQTDCIKGNQEDIDEIKLKRFNK